MGGAAAAGTAAMGAAAAGTAAMGAAAAAGTAAMGAAASGTAAIGAAAAKTALIGAAAVGAGAVGAAAGGTVALGGAAAGTAALGAAAGTAALGAAAGSAVRTDALGVELRSQRQSNGNGKRTSITWNGIWGDWGSKVYCPEGSYVTGFQLKSDDYSGDDETALNGVRLFCQWPWKDHTTQIAHTLTSSVGSYGTWGSKGWCETGPIDGYKVRFESKISGDNTALNDVKVSCEEYPEASYSVSAGVETSWGSWRDWKFCRSGFAVMGLQTKLDERKPGMTGLNGIRMICKKYIR